MVVDPNKYYPIIKEIVRHKSMYTVAGELGIYTLSLWNENHPYSTDKKIIIIPQIDLLNKNVNTMVEMGEATALTNEEFIDYIQEILYEGFILAENYYDSDSILKENYELQTSVTHIPVKLANTDPICTNCRTNPANPGKSWCQTCHLKQKNQKICTNCQINVSNPGKSWCQTCYLSQKNNQISLDEFINAVRQIKTNIKLGNYDDIKNIDRIPTALRYEVWKKYISAIHIKGKCFCCRSNEISISNFECGHVISRKNGGPTTLQNLRPICSQCNKSMGTRDMDEFIISCGFWNEGTIKSQPANITLPLKETLQYEEISPSYTHSRPRSEKDGKYLTKRDLQMILNILNLDQKGNFHMLRARITKNKNKLQTLSMQNLNTIASIVFPDKVIVSVNNRNEVIDRISSKFTYNPDRPFAIEEYKIILRAIDMSLSGNHDDLVDRILKNIDKLWEMEYDKLEKLRDDLILEENDDREQIINQITARVKYLHRKPH